MPKTVLRDFADFPIHPSYQERTAFFVNSARHWKESIDPAAAGGLLLKDEAIILAVEANHAGIVTKAVFSGANGVRAGLLECLCNVAEGRPLAEIREHGALRVERLLRNPNLPPPVPGLVTPKSADPEFAWLHDFLSQLNSASILPKVNTWIDPPSSQWATQSSAEQLDLINTSIPMVLPAVGWQGRPPRAVAIEHRSRVVLSYDTTRDIRNEGGALMALERTLKHTIDPCLEIVLESLEDRNRREERSILQKQKLLAAQNLSASGRNE